jgi:hypothetical protein
MKKILIKSLSGVNFAGATLEDPTAWIAEGVSGNWWGLPERWVLHKDELMAEASYDDADVLEEEMRELTPAVEAILDEQGVEVSPAVPAVMQKWVKLKAKYTVEIEDITAQVAQDAINAEALAYLASTDWLIIREVDAGVPCPADIKTLRAEARAKVVR